MSLDSGSKKKTERRKSKRFDTPMIVEYRTLTHNPIHGNAKVRNISKEGVAMEKAESIEKGEAVHLKMNVPGDNHPVFATAKVAWVNGNSAGVRLTRISESDQERILEHVYQTWLERLNKGKSKKS